MDRRKKATRSIHDVVPDDLLWRILLRLDSPIWLVRAARVCKRWRRIVTNADQGRGFLRLARSLHPPTVVGHYRQEGIDNITRFLPSSTSSVDGGRFSVDTILAENPRRRGWHIVDCHGGLLLLGTPYERSAVPNVIVYDPLTRQHRPILLPPPPSNDEEAYDYAIKDTFLLAGDGGTNNASISNFRVLFWLDPDATGALACVFSAANGGEWDWRFTSGLADEDDDSYLRRCTGERAGRAANGAIYLSLDVPAVAFDRSRMVALDMASLVFSRVHLPSRLRLETAMLSSSTFTLVVDHATTTGVIRPCWPTARTSIVHVCGEELELFRQVHGTSEWVLEHSIPNLSSVATRGLSICLQNKEDVTWTTMAGVIADDAAAIAILSASSLLDSCIIDNQWFFSFDVNTMEMRVLPQQELYRGTWKIFNYTLPWPQFLRACPCS